jgi:integrase
MPHTAAIPETVRKRKMIKFVKRGGVMAVWDIDGIEVSFKYLQSRNETITKKKIKRFKEALELDLYKEDYRILNKYFQFFGLKTFIDIGMVWRQNFLRCFSYYSDLYAAEWVEKDNVPRAVIVGAYNIFERMLYGQTVSAAHKINLSGRTTAHSRLFYEIAKQSFQDLWSPRLSEAMRNVESLENICRKLGGGHVTGYLMCLEKEIERYLEEIARRFTERRELISLRKINDFVFGEDSRTNFNGCSPDFFRLLNKTAESEYEIQKQRFVAENQISMNIRGNQWTLYYWHGASLRFRKIDFTEIRCVSMRSEVKYFLRRHYSGAISIESHIYSNIIRAVNILCENNPSIRYFSDIDNTDVKSLHIALENCGEITQPSIMLTFFHCRAVMDYLMGDDRDPNIKAPPPRRNPFKDIVFVNARKYNKNTPYIPDDILTRIEKQLEELPGEDQLAFRIFMETGMRAKEVVFLEESCLETARYQGKVKLRYVLYKVLTARRLAGLEDYHNVYISEELAQRISEQSDKTKNLRLKHNLPYIFLHEHTWNKTPVFNTRYFVVRINKLIERHGICDKNGELWRFGSRQCRKTLAVTMIENGATAEELTYQFGHLDASTVTQYYAEVKAMKLAELNSAFFKENFDILLSKDLLCEYTEEERRQLYVDFRLGLRRVEFGFCAKRLSEGACGSRQKLYNCVACRHLCTGKSYLSYWEELRASQEYIVDELVRVYGTEGIENYHDFIEYRQEKRMLEAYTDITVRIRESDI